MKIRDRAIFLIGQLEVLVSHDSSSDLADVACQVGQILQRFNTLLEKEQTQPELLERDKNRLDEEIKAYESKTAELEKAKQAYASKEAELGKSIEMLMNTLGPMQGHMQTMQDCMKEMGSMTGKQDDSANAIQRYVKDAMNEQIKAHGAIVKFVEGQEGNVTTMNHKTAMPVNKDATACDGLRSEFIEASSSSLDVEQTQAEKLRDAASRVPELKDATTHQAREIPSAFQSMTEEVKDLQTETSILDSEADKGGRVEAPLNHAPNPLPSRTTGSQTTPEAEHVCGPGPKRPRPIALDTDNYRGSKRTRHTDASVESIEPPQNDYAAGLSKEDLEGLDVLRQAWEGTIDDFEEVFAMMRPATPIPKRYARHTCHMIVMAFVQARTNKLLPAFHDYERAVKKRGVSDEGEKWACLHHFCETGQFRVLPSSGRCGKCHGFCVQIKREADGSYGIKRVSQLFMPTG